MARFSFKSSGAAKFNKQFDKYLKVAEVAFITRRGMLIKDLTQRIIELTPVWEGDTLVNWRWSIGAPDYSLKTPIGVGDPGPTNTMPLGTEPRRPANAAVVLESMADAIKYQGFDTLYFANPSEGAIPLEYGLWPGGPGQDSRSPRGVVRLAIKQVMGWYRTV